MNSAATAVWLYYRCSNGCYSDDASPPGSIQLCSQFPDSEGRGVDDTCYKDLDVKFDRVKQNGLNFKRDSLSCFGKGRIPVSEIFMDLGFVMFVFLCC